MTTAEAIHHLYLERAKEEKPRSYVGWSALGDPCSRRLWYGLRWCLRPSFDGRMYRLFNTGHLEEDRVLDDLRGIGCTVHDSDPATGHQIAVAPLCDGHLKGHVDAVVEGLSEHPGAVLVDVKTASRKKFDEVVAKGMAACYPKYVTQAMGYMGLLELKKAAYIFVCKDDDRIHVEWLDFDEQHFDAAVDKAQKIIDSEIPSVRLSNEPDSFACKWCDCRELCHGETMVADVNCRTCSNSTPVADGNWHCQIWGENIPKENQLTGCSAHVYIPDLVTIATAVNGGENHVLYRRKNNGKEFINSPPDPNRDDTYTSAEIAANAQFIAHEFADAVKKNFGARVVG